MRRQVRNQLVLDLDRGGRRGPPAPAPEGLLQALVDLLLDALGKAKHGDTGRAGGV
jgi:hypothetical protein